MKVRIYDNVIFLEEQNCIKINEVKHLIEGKQSSLLSFLIRNEGVVFSKEEILEKVWKSVVTDQVVVQAVFKLRKLFKDNNLESPIVTIPQKGYLYESRTIKEDGSWSGKMKRRIILNNILNAILMISIFMVGFYYYSLEKFEDNGCDTINCNNIVYVKYDKDSSEQQGLLNFINWHFSVNHNISFSSSNDFESISSRVLDINFKKRKIIFYDENLKGNYFEIVYSGKISKSEFLLLMMNLEERILLDYEHEDLTLFYNGLPNESEAFNLFLSSIGDPKGDLFNNFNIKKLELAGNVDIGNQYIFSMEYIVKLFYLYDIYYKDPVLKLEIEKLNSHFLSDLKNIKVERYNDKTYEALAAYELSIGDPYKSLEYLSKLDLKEKTLYGLFLKAKTEELLKEKDISNAKYMKIYENIGSRNYKVMMKSFK